MMARLARLWAGGAAIDWQKLWGSAKRLRVPLPTYPFERSRIWAKPEISQQEALWRKASGQGRLGVDEWFYAPSWRRSEELELPPDHPARQEKFCWLIADLPDGDDLPDGNSPRQVALLGEALAGLLRDDGHEVVRVLPGQHYRKVSPRDYRLHPARREEWAALVDDLSASQRRPLRAIHLWSLGGEAAGRDCDGLPVSRPVQDACFWSLLGLAQALVRPDGEPARIEIVT